MDISIWTMKNSKVYRSYCRLMLSLRLWRCKIKSSQQERRKLKVQITVSNNSMLINWNSIKTECKRFTNKTLNHCLRHLPNLRSKISYRRYHLSTLLNRILIMVTIWVNTLKTLPEKILKGGKRYNKRSKLGNF